MLLIAFLLTFFVIYAGAHLRIRTKLEALGSFYKFLSWFIMIMGFVVMLGIGTRLTMSCCCGAGFPEGMHNRHDHHAGTKCMQHDVQDHSCKTTQPCAMHGNKEACGTGSGCSMCGKQQGNRRRIIETSWSEKTFMIKRETIAMADLQGFFGRSYEAMYRSMGKAGISPRGAPFAIYYSVDTVKKVVDLAAAVPIAEKASVPPEFSKITIPQSKALVLTHVGPYDQIAPAYAKLDMHVLNNDLEKTWVMEEYLTDPAAERDTANWKTKVYYLVK